MSISQYAKDSFLRDVNEIEMKKGWCVGPDGENVAGRCFGASTTWEDFTVDVKKVNPKDLADFIAVIFVAATTDSVLYKYYPSKYKKFNNPLLDVKFGRVDSDEKIWLNPVRVLIDRAQKEGVLDGKGVEFINEWADFFVENVKAMKKIDGEIEPAEFMGKLLADESLQPGNTNDRHVFDVLIRKLGTYSL